MPNPIWTLEARDSVMLEVVASQFNLSPEAMRREISQAHQITVEAIAAKGISYSELRNSLTPQRNRLERALLFDTARIEEGWYGLSVAKALIPLLPTELSCSIRLGDLIIDDEDLGFELLKRHVMPYRSIELMLTNQIYCIYLNNLTPTMAKRITEGLHDYHGYSGYVDTTNSSPMKDWLSICLVDGYLKHRGVALSGHEDDVSDSEDLNPRGWPWEEHGYSCRSIRDMYFHLFLGYKIERRVVPGAEGDTDFALTAISGNPLPLVDLPVEVAQAKGNYVREQHGGSLVRAGLESMEDEDLAELIRAKISESYIYNLRYDEKHDASLFNIMLEVSEPGEGLVTRLLAALEYEPGVPRLRLVTLY